jgi:hypothetical protein
MYRVEFRSEIVRMTHNIHHIDWLNLFGFHETVQFVCMSEVSVMVGGDYPLVIIET